MKILNNNHIVSIKYVVINQAISLYFPHSPATIQNSVEFSRFRNFLFFPHTNTSLGSRTMYTSTQMQTKYYAAALHMLTTTTNYIEWMLGICFQFPKCVQSKWKQMHIFNNRPPTFTSMPNIQISQLPTFWPSLGVVLVAVVFFSLYCECVLFLAHYAGIDEFLCWTTNHSGIVFDPKPFQNDV